MKYKKKRDARLKVVNRRRQFTHNQCPQALINSNKPACQIPDNENGALVLLPAED